MAPANFSVGYRESKNYNKIARMFFSRIGRLWQHQGLETHSRSSQCGLTPRSRRGPTSKRQARAAGWRIFHRTGLAFRCRSRLSSNVRQRRKCPAVLQRKINSGRREWNNHDAQRRAQPALCGNETDNKRRSIGSGCDSLNSQQQRRGAAVPHGCSELRGKHWLSVSSSGRRNQHWRAYLGDHRGGLNAWHPTVAGAEREAAVAGHEE